MTALYLPQIPDAYTDYIDTLHHAAIIWRHPTCAGKPLAVIPAAWREEAAVMLADSFQTGDPALTDPCRRFFQDVIHERIGYPRRFTLEERDWTADKLRWLIHAIMQRGTR